MKYLLTITALILTLACTKKSDSTLTTTDDNTAPSVENVEPAEGTGNVADANDTTAAAPGAIVRDEDNKAVKDKEGDVVRESNTSSSQPAK